MPVRIDDDAFERLGEMLEPPPPPTKRKKKGEKEAEPWHPRLGPKQTEIFNSTARYVLAHGEKGSGKSMGLLHKLVRHAYENENALCLILVRVRAMATKGGAWDKLVHYVLPCWRDGNRDRDGKLLDEGLGIKFSDVKFDSQHNEFIWVENRFVGWSMVVLISAPHAAQLRERIRGYEPSFVLVDELTSCDSPEYLVAVAAQVGRRPNIAGIQQYTAACNPDGKRHWVYKKWWIEAFNEETQEFDPDYARYHVPIAENKENLPDGYLENLEKLYRGDPVERARMMHGEWVDRPSGEAIFVDVWIPTIHIQPSPDSLDSIMPLDGYPIVIGMDPGAANNAFIFEQMIPMENGLGWLIFDEVVTIRKRIVYGSLFPVVLRRLVFWRAQQTVPSPIVWISDNSAFNQFRASSGSYDVLELQKIGDVHTPALGLPRVRVQQAPKFKGSVTGRVRTVMDLLGQQRFVVSARCTHVKDMFNNLESERPGEGKAFDPELSLTPRRSDHIHVFDAMSYPILTGAIAPQLLAPRDTGGSQKMVAFGS